MSGVLLFCLRRKVMFGAAQSVLPVLGGMERTFNSTLDQFKCVADL